MPRARPSTTAVVLGGDLCLLALLGLLRLPTGAGHRPSAPAAGQRMDASPSAPRAYGDLALSFVPNAGQSDARVRYQAQAGGASFFFTEREAVVALAGEKQRIAFRLAFLDANRRVSVGGERRPGGLGADAFRGGDGRDRATDYTPVQGDTKQSVEVF